MNDESITIVITRRVRPGREKAFERAVQDWIPRAVTFPGHLGAFLLHPHPTADSPRGREYGAVLRFRSMSLWKAFEESLEYREFLESIRPDQVDAPRVEAATGLEAWFRWTGTTQPPPRWKMAIVTWVGVCLTVGVLGILLGPGMSGWPPVARLLVMNAAVVVVLTWGVMPLLTRLTHRWLRPGRQDVPRPGVPDGVAPPAAICPP